MTPQELLVSIDKDHGDDRMEAFVVIGVGISTSDNPGMLPIKCTQSVKFHLIEDSWVTSFLYLGVKLFYGLPIILNIYTKQGFSSVSRWTMGRAH